MSEYREVGMENSLHFPIGMVANVQYVSKEMDERCGLV